MLHFSLSPPLEDEHMSHSAIPVIPLSSPSCPSLLLSACQNTGFFYLTHHGVDEGLVERVFEQSKEFFSLPLEEKEKCNANANGRGYTAMGEETLDPANQTSGDTKVSRLFLLFVKNYGNSLSLCVCV